MPTVTVVNESSFLAKDKASIISAINEKNWDYPFVQKARTEGYDGKGVQVIKAPENLDQLWDRPSVIEVAVQIDKELAIIIARSSHGSIAVYDPVEMVFDGEANVLDYQKSPASITETQKQTLEKIARNLADKLDLVGVLAVEFFLTVSGDIRVNEAAPRTHNSGHHTIEACRCSQFEQQIRAISGLPLGDTQLISPSSMLNVLGEVDALGIAHYEGLEDVLNIPEAKVHLYGKQSVKPNWQELNSEVNIDYLEQLARISTIDSSNNFYKSVRKQKGIIGICGTTTYSEDVNSHLWVAKQLYENYGKIYCFKYLQQSCVMINEDNDYAAVVWDNIYHLLIRSLNEYVSIDEILEQYKLSAITMISSQNMRSENSYVGWNEKSNYFFDVYGTRIYLKKESCPDGENKYKRCQPRDAEKIKAESQLYAAIKEYTK